MWRHSEGEREIATTPTSLREAWDRSAGDWERWARAPGHDSFWRFHGRRFLELMPPPGRLTVDIGCGEGRLGRELLALGHRVVALDGSFSMARSCTLHQVAQPTLVADAAALPLRSGGADLAVAFMVLQDVDDLAGAIAEAGRLLTRGGRLCLAIVHPLNSAGRFAGERADRDAPFVVQGSYLASFRYRDDIERDGLAMTFHSEHRPLEAYSRALEGAGLVVEAIREVTEDNPDDRWSRIPLFLHLLALRQ